MSLQKGSTAVVTLKVILFWPWCTDYIPQIRRPEWVVIYIILWFQNPWELPWAINSTIRLCRFLRQRKPLIQFVLDVAAATVRCGHRHSFSFIENFKRLSKDNWLNVSLLPCLVFLCVRRPLPVWFANLTTLLWLAFLIVHLCLLHRTTAENIRTDLMMSVKMFSVNNSWISLSTL